MLHEFSEVSKSLPNKQVGISANHLANESRTHAWRQGSSMLVYNVALHCQLTSPAHFPRSVGKIGILDVQGGEEVIQATQPKVFLPIQGHRAAMPPKHANIFSFLINGKHRLVCPI